MARSPSVAQQSFASTQLSTPTSTFSFGTDTLASSHHAPSSSHVASSSSTLVGQSTYGLTGSEMLRNLFRKRLQSLLQLKSSMQSKHAWFRTIDMPHQELAQAFDNHRMRKRTLRYMLFGLSLSSILDLPQPSDVSRAIISLANELDSYADDALVALTTGGGGPSNGAQRGPKVRNFFKTGAKTLKRSTAAQAISEFASMDSTSGPASAEHTSYLVTPNLPFQLDFFQTFYTLCDMLTEVYYKLLAYLPAESEAKTMRNTGKGSSDNAQTQQYSLASALSNLDGGADSQAQTATLSAATQELMLKADGKIKKMIHQQVKEIDVLARQMIKNEFAALDPLLAELDFSSASIATSNANGQTTAATTSGLPSGSTLPFSMNQGSQPPQSAGSATGSFPSIPSAFRSRPAGRDPAT